MKLCRGVIDRNTVFKSIDEYIAEIIERHKGDSDRYFIEKAGVKILIVVPILV